ncbi:MAG: hypothetical protein N3B18_05095 [Desulfobacterota bacterium]|nr:hypothetical protein [Thermodesulfobacteriota bacterium]
MEKSAFMDQALTSLRLLPLTPVAIEPTLSRIEAQGGVIDIDVYRCEKIEKVVLCSIRLHETGVLEQTVLAWPDEHHNFPILWCNLTVVPSVMNVPIFDFIPLMDIVVWPDYAATYIAGVQELKSRALETLGDAVIDKAVDLPSLTIYTLSPYRVVCNIKDDGVEKVPSIIDIYIQAYAQLWRSAQPVTGTDRDFYLKKRAATRSLMKGNDPGYPFMVDVFGEENTARVFDTVF